MPGGGSPPCGLDGSPRRRGTPSPGIFPAINAQAQRWLPCSYLLSAVVILGGLPLALHFLPGGLPLPALSAPHGYGLGAGSAAFDRHPALARAQAALMTLVADEACDYGRLPGTWVEEGPPGSHWQLLPNAGGCQLEPLLPLHAAADSPLANAAAEWAGAHPSMPEEARG
jgi:hypothetical protein